MYCNKPNWINIYKLVFTGFICFFLLTGCKRPNPAAFKITSVDSVIKAKIAEGNRLENVNSDSLKITTEALYELYKQSGKDSAMVYADFFEAIYYWHNAAHQKAMQLAIKALAAAQKAGLTATLPRIYLLITSIETEITDYKPVFTTLHASLSSAIKEKDTSSIIALHGLESMLTRRDGVAKKDGKLLDKSLEINYAALKMAASNIKYEWLKIRLFNTLGQCYTDKKDLRRASGFFEKAIPLAIKYNQPLSLIRSYCKLGEVLYYMGDKTRGIDYLQNALTLARRHGASFWLLETTSAIYRCYISSKNYELGMRYDIQNRNIRDSLRAITDVRRIGELRLRYEAAKKDKEINLLNTQNKLERLLLYTAALVVLLLAVIAALYYLKQKKERKLLLAEKALLDDELRRAEIELNNFTENLKDKNTLIEEFNTRIEQLRLQNVSNDDIQNMEQSLKAHIMTEESWARFKKLFTKVYPDFLINLKNKKLANASLTATDTRILVLIKLQLSNVEMASLTGVTVEGIKKSKQRLRKKLGLEETETLSQFVDNV